MKAAHIILMLCSVFFTAASQENDPIASFMNDFTIVSETYYEQMIPYIDSLAEKQFPPLKAGATETEQIIRRERVRTIAHVHKTKVRKFINESLDYFKEKKASTYSEGETEMLVNYFDFGLKTQYPYLDYVFYEENKKIIANKLKS